MDYITPVVGETEITITPRACTSSFTCNSGFTCNGYTCKYNFKCSTW